MKTTYQLLIFVGLITFALILPAASKSETSSISTQQVKLTVSAVRVSEIKANQAKCSFTVQGSPISEKGVCFSEGPSPIISKKSMSPSNPTNSGTSIISGLKSSKKSCGDVIFFLGISESAG